MLAACAKLAVRPAPARLDTLSVSERTVRRQCGARRGLFFAGDADRLCDCAAVGWSQIDPVNTFHFSGRQAFTGVTVWHDDANSFGNVATPFSFTVTVGGRSQSFDIIDPAGDTPFASVLALGSGFIGDTLELQVFRRDSGVFVSEVAFTAAVPEPATWLLMAAGVAALRLKRLARRRQ